MNFNHETSGWNYLNRMIYTTLMNTEITQKLLTSLFQIPEEYRARLASIAEAGIKSSEKSSINSCIIDALETYLDLPEGTQSKPSLPKVPLRAFTVRTTPSLKQKISHCAATWQIKSALPVSMNAVVNTAILSYLQKTIPGYQPHF